MEKQNVPRKYKYWHQAEKCIKWVIILTISIRFLLMHFKIHHDYTGLRIMVLQVPITPEIIFQI